MYNLNDAPWIGNADYNKSSKDDKVVCVCKHCGMEICNGDEYVDFNGDYYCTTECLFEDLDNEIEYITDEECVFEGEHFDTTDSLHTYITEEILYRVADINEMEF